MFIIEPRQG